MRIDVGNTMSIHLLSIIFSLLALGKRGFFLCFFNYIVSKNKEKRLFIFETLNRCQTPSKMVLNGYSVKEYPSHCF